MTSISTLVFKIMSQKYLKKIRSTLYILFYIQIPSVFFFFSYDCGVFDIRNRTTLASAAICLSRTSRQPPNISHRTIPCINKTYLFISIKIFVFPDSVFPSPRSPSRSSYLPMQVHAFPLIPTARNKTGAEIMINARYT